MKLGQKLKEARLNAGLKQEELAKQLGVSRQTISSWENDRSYPDLGSAVKLSNLYGESLDEMLKDGDSVIKAFEDLALKRRKFWQMLQEIGIIIQTAGVLLIGLDLFTPGCFIAVAGAGVLYLALIMHLRVFNHDRGQILRGTLGIFVHGLLLLTSLMDIPWASNTLSVDILRLAAIFLIWSADVWTIDWKSTRLWLIIVLYIATPMVIAGYQLKPVSENTSVNPFTGIYLIEEVLSPEDGMDTDNTRVALRRVFTEEPYMTIYETDEPYPFKDDLDYFHYVDPAPGTGQLGTWQMVPAEDESLAYWLTVEADNSVLLSFYENDQLQWKWKLVEEDPVIASVSVNTYGRMVVFSADWYETGTHDPEPDFQGQTDINGKATMNIALTHPETETLTLIEEYHHGSSVETATYTLEPKQTGSFTMQLETRYDGENEWALYRIPYQDGEYRFILTYGK